jgi:acyl dehydratase
MARPFLPRPDRGRSHAPRHRGRQKISGRTKEYTLERQSGWHPVHCDREFMKQNGLGSVRAQGSLGIALSLGSHLESAVLVSSEKFVKALGVDQWSYGKPLVAGDTIHLEVQVAEKKLLEDGKRYIITRRVRIVNQDDIVIQEGLASSMWERSL